MRKFVFLASLAAMIVMAVPAMASALTLTANGNTLGAGALITATSSDLVFTGDQTGFELLCPTELVEGEYLGGSEIAIEAGTFDNGEGGACATNDPATTVHIEATNLPWTLHLNAEDKAVITGLQFTTTFTQGGVSVNHCTFTAAGGVVNGTYTTTEPLSITIPGATLVGAPLEVCGTATLAGSFDTITSEGHDVEAH